jgi:hypothetical protein
MWAGPIFAEEERRGDVALAQSLAGPRARGSRRNAALTNDRFLGAALAMEHARPNGFVGTRESHDDAPHTVEDELIGR